MIKKLHSKEIKPMFRQANHSLLVSIQKILYIYIHVRQIRVNITCTYTQRNKVTKKTTLQSQGVG